MARPVIPPVEQSRSTLAIFQDLAAGLGFEDDVFSLDEMDFIDGFLNEMSPYLKGLDFEALKSGRPVRLNIPSNPYARGFSTPSGKVEFYSQTMADRGLDPLPDGQPLRDPDGKNRYSLEFITPPHHFFLLAKISVLRISIIITLLPCGCILSMWIIMRLVPDV